MEGLAGNGQGGKARGKLGSTLVMVKSEGGGQCVRGGPARGIGTSPRQLSYHWH